MALIKTLKFLNGIATPIDTSNDSLVAKSYVVGGASGTDLTKAILDTLSGGTSSDATALHSHDSRYFTKGQHIAASTGVANAAAPIETDARGKLDPSFYQQSDIVHGNLSGLASDDHPQYYNQTRGDARYFTKAQHINVSAGVASAALPIITDSRGKIDNSFIDSAASNHEQLSGLLGGAANDHFHFTQAQHDTLTTGTASDATTLHSHDSRYYTKTQSDASLALKADLTVVIKKDGSVAFTGDQSHGGHKITSMADGSAASDAATVGQMQVADALKVSKSGDTMSGTLNMASNAITGLPTPVNANDAATKGYVDAATAGLTIKAPVIAASTVNIPLTGSTPLLVDGVAVTAGQRLLLKDQTTGVQNGIYDFSSSAGTYSLSRSSDFTQGFVAEGDYVYVDTGATWGYTQWVLTTIGTITVGSTPLTFTRYSGAGQIVAGVGIQKVGDTLSVILGAGIKQHPTNEVGIDLYASSGLDLVDPSTGLTSAADTAQLSLKIAGSTLSKSSTGVQVAAAGITPTELNSSVAGSGLTGGAGVALSVVLGKGHQIIGNAISIKVSDFAGSGLIDDGSNNLKLNPTVAGSGLAMATPGILSAVVDNATLQITGGALAVKVIQRANIAAAAVGSAQIDFGTAAAQVKASDVPVLDAANSFATKNVAAALQELANAAYIESFTAGEAIGIGDLVCMRRDASNALTLWKASAASADNVNAATLTFVDVVFTALNDFSRSGNDITVAFVNPAVINATLAVSATGRAITVSLATNAAGAITSTASQIVTAVNSTPASNVLVSASTANGTAIQTAHSVAPLTGGFDYNDNGRWKVKGVALDSAAAAGTSVRVQKSGEVAPSFLVAPTTADIGKSVYLSINRGKAQVYYAPISPNEGLVYLGELSSLTQVEFMGRAILRGVNG